ncbi:MAG: flagellar biosynthesis protein FlhB [Magnetococcales bacterium]|nr:flagellar biosynthesis protein FlhB [Magnetococcales bacterium]MBF0322529.1 flagellar biosynthesis protein FlhB [Magnetococcales bacterium]
MAGDADNDAKTEAPTSKRLQEARDKGQTANSREVPTALILLSALTLFIFQGPGLWEALRGKMAFFLSGQIHDDLTEAGVIALLRDVLTLVLGDMGPFFAVFIVAGIAASIIQHGWMFTLQPLAPNFSKVNPFSGLKRLFSMQSVVELFKSIMKMSLVSIAVYLGIKDSSLQVLTLTNSDVPTVLAVLMNDSLAILWRVTLAFLILAFIDFSYQKFNYIKGLRMTKQEIKDELRQTEGDPMLKGRIRQVQREMAQRRMMQEVPKADVVITNPTHYAVALRYTPGEMLAPKVVAKGVDAVASRIRTIAGENKVPLVENPPLARTLFKDVDLDQTIPPDLFKAVAQVLAYVFSLRGKRNRVG